MDNIPQNQQFQTFLENIYDRYKVPLLRIVYKYTGSIDISEDLLHEVFIRIIKNVELLNRLPQHKLEAYIALVARGVSIDYLRKTHRDMQIDIADDILFNLRESKDQYWNQSFDQFQKIDLSLMIRSLPADEQLLLVGKYYLGLSVNELIHIVGGTPTAIRSKLHRAKKYVFTQWHQAGLHLEDFIDE